ncbi:DNA-3-methyladenine glycosylase [Mesobacillus subterraneus]|uniref:DNA-3-methyladenine glycosylase n=1 Tax=Mesobacillus subterraneus TaxID=285983 RepID=UPI00273D427B|nr:DNA-3-methyladenine glycosylase [Mesobacillus subterraneus]WLR54050.1 DNA-3-methyladenine glycosylase [Mesobacillus subterraneus]
MRIFQALDNEFFQQPTLELVVSLLGCILVKETEEGTAAGMIVETEAYVGPMDKATHSFNNRRTKRTEIMYHESGLAYTYVMHTHTLFNVVSGGKDHPEAVLIRAIEPVEGIHLMVERRGMPESANLTNGPGKLSKAMGINTGDYGHPLTEKPLYISQGLVPESISSGKRIGIDNSGEARDYPWRYWITGNRYVSRHQNAEKIIKVKDVSKNGGTK